MPTYSQAQERHVISSSRRQQGNFKLRPFIRVCAVKTKASGKPRTDTIEFVICIFKLET